jgi:hypothetical protein
MSLTPSLLAKHGEACPYCGTIMRARRNRPTKLLACPTRDHVIPKHLVKGSRVEIVCLGCNRDKSHLTLREWAAVLEVRGDPRLEHVRKFMNANPDLAHHEGFA